MSQETSSGPTTSNVPDFPLIPASKGFCLTLERNIEALQSALQEVREQTD